MSRRFDWDNLRHFLAVARAGTVAEAARQLQTDHATIIRRIDGLEQSLGAKLFQRNPRGYNLTRSGERLLTSARTIEIEAQSLEQEFGGKSQMMSGLVHIITLEGFGNFYLAARLPRFTNQHPNLTIKLVTLQQIVALSRREADISITLQPPDSGPFLRERLTDYTLFVYASRHYLDNGPPIKCRRDLQAHRFVGYIEELIFMRGLDHLDEVVPGLRASIQSSSLHAQMEAIIAGYGLGVLPAFMAFNRPDLIRVMPEEIAIRRSYWMVASTDMANSPRIQAVRQFIKDTVSKDQALFSG